MNKPILTLAGALGLSILIGSTLAAAQGRGGGHAGGPGVARGTTGFANQSDLTPPGFRQGRKTGWVNGRPPGWNKGKKTGWNGGKTPPGLR